MPADSSLPLCAELPEHDIAYEQPCVASQIRQFAWGLPITRRSPSVSATIHERGGVLWRQHRVTISQHDLAPPALSDMTPFARRSIMR